MAWFAATTMDGGDGVAPLAEALPEDLAGRIKAELGPGERLLWAGRAVRRPASSGASPRAMSSWMMGCLFVAGAGFALILGGLGRASEEAAVVVAVLAAIGAFFGVMIGLGIAIRLAADASLRRQAASLVYALTDARAILWRPRPGTTAVEVHSVAARSLPGLHRVEFPDGTGDVVFGGTGTLPPDINGFLGIAEVRRVEALARDILVDPDPRPDPSPRRRAEVEEYS